MNDSKKNCCGVYSNGFKAIVAGVCFFLGLPASPGEQAEFVSLQLAADADAPEVRLALPGHVHAVVDDTTDAVTVYFFFPEETDLSQVQPVLQIPDGYALAPRPEPALDFRQPVCFTLSKDGVDFTWRVEAFHFSVEHALRLNGESAHVEIQNNFGLFDGKSAFSIELWLNPRSLPEDDDWRDAPVAVSLVGENNFRITLADGSGTPDRVGARAQFTQANWRTVVETSPLVVNNWRHIAVVYDPQSGWILYENGVEAAANPITETIRGASGASYLGAGPHDGRNKGFDGMMREVRFWRTALSRQDIQSRMKSKANGNEPGLAACWPLDHGEGHVAIDVSENQRPGRIVDGTWALASVRVHDANGTPASRGLAALLAGTADADVPTLLSAIASIGDAEATRELVTLLNSPRLPVRIAAAQSLGAMGTAAAIPALLARLDDPQLTGRMAAVRALDAIAGAGNASEVDNGLIAALGNATTRAGAVLAAQQIADRRLSDGFPALKMALTHADADVTAAAAKAIGDVLENTADAEAVAALAGLIADSRHRVRDNAAAALGRIGGDEAKALLLPTPYADWPMWGYDVKRSGRSPLLPAPLPRSTDEKPELGETLVDFDTRWRYHDGNEDLGVEWKEHDYDDSGWKIGGGLLGYDTGNRRARWPEPGLQTQLATRLNTYYFRTAFHFDGDSSTVSLVIEQIIDDGAVYYLNGREIARSEWMPKGPVGFGTTATRAINPWEPQPTLEVANPPLRAGRNILAASVHNASPTSSDICFGVRVSTPTAAPSGLTRLRWKRHLPAPRRAWPEQLDDKDKLEFDLSYSPIVADGRLFVASMNNDSLTAYALETGVELWRHYADGPIRLAPAAWEGKVYFVSDDGHLTCLDGASGDLLWKFDARPSDHRTLGNGRVISFWPARGGPLVDDGVVYFAAGIWPFLGTFVFAVDAETGNRIWANTGHASEWQRQPHGGAYSFAGVAPQGYLALSGDRLIVSGGRSLPALFDRHDGSLLHAVVDGKDIGGYRVSADDTFYYNHGRRHRLSDGADAGRGEPDNRALERLVDAVRHQLDDAVFEVIVARGNLIVSTRRGTLYCFGDGGDAPTLHPLETRSPEPADTPAGRLADTLLQSIEDPRGYALFLGAGNGDLIEQLAVRSDLHIVAIEPNPARVDALRRRFDAQGLYGGRVALINADPSTARYPQSVSSLIVLGNWGVFNDAPDVAMLNTIYTWLIPYHGRAFISRGSGATTAALDAALAAFTPDHGAFESHGGMLVIRREGPVTGAGQWTHQHADSAQTVMSRDAVVRPPFGPIWFGSTSNANILPRHAAGPRPQVAGGRLVILGVEDLTGRCVFTGRNLWIRTFPGIGHPFTDMALEARWQAGASVYMSNQPGASYIGSPYVTLPDAIYLRYQNQIVRLDPGTGATVAEWPLPAIADEATAIDWGHISVCGDVILTTTDPYIFREGKLGTWGDDSWDATSSKRLVAIHRQTGEVLWTRDAEIAFRHNAIASHGDRVFVNDLLTEEAVGMADRRGMTLAEQPKLSALNLHTGETLWTVESEVFGTFLSYSAEHDTLVEGGSRDGRRTLTDEPLNRLIARRGADGRVIWRLSGTFQGPLVVHGDSLFSGRPGPAISLLTGASQKRRHPITDEETDWSYWKAYGCGMSNAGEHVLLFRSGSAGFADLEHDGGTGTLGGFKSGCTASMIPAEGVLSAPDYTRTCTCSYQNQTSLGLVHMPEMDMWMVNQPISTTTGRIRRMGINFGAPGDRRAADGTLWIPFPRGGSPGPESRVEMDDTAEFFRQHSLLVDGADGLNWVAASGVKNPGNMTIPGINGGGAAYTLTLHFAEPESIEIGKRVFDVVIDGKTVAESVDILALAGSPNRAATLSIPGVPIGDTVTITLKSLPGQPHPPIICGVELHIEADATDT